MGLKWERDLFHHMYRENKTKKEGCVVGERTGKAGYVSKVRQKEGEDEC